MFHTAVAISRTDLGPSSKSLNPNPVNTWDHVIPSAFYSFHLISFTRISRGQSHHKSGSLNNKYEYHSTSQSNVRTPSVTSSEPLAKGPENPSGATADCGPCRDQLLDHGGMAVLSRHMQHRPASGAEDATRTAGQLRLPSRNKAYSHGMFLRVVGQILLDRS